MPFNQFLPRIMSTSGVNVYAPQASGVYGISNAHEWIYVGEADNIQAALLGHLREVDTSVMKRSPTGFVFEICEPGPRSTRHDQLVREYEPMCNRESPRKTDPKGDISVASNKTS